MPKKLYRSNDNVMLAGVLAGIGEFLNIDPTIVRVGFVVLLFISAFVPLSIAYLVTAMIIPKSDVYNR